MIKSSEVEPVAGELAPAPRVRSVTPYAPSRHGAPTDLDLSGTESRGPGAALLKRGWNTARGTLGRYPNASPLAGELAAPFGIDPARVVVTAGADEAIDRVCRAVLSEGRNAIVTDPTFEMIPRYVALAGATSRAVAWPDGAFPVQGVIAAADAATSLVAIVSPNNPTGAVATLDDVRRIHDAIPSALVLVDLAYVDYADRDITTELLALPRVVIVRTLSKAWGMPGIRIGYAVASIEVAGWLRAVGGPYPVSSVSLELARATLAGGATARTRLVRAVQRNRARLAKEMQALGAAPTDGEGSFVCATGSRASWLADALAGQGIATRFFRPTEPDATARVRIAVPPDARAFNRLRAAVRVALSPQALLFDLDGVLAEVSGSYDAAVIRTAASFGITVSRVDVLARRARGNANDDWALTAAIISERSGANVPLDEVTAAFERIYQGAPGAPGLRETERLTVEPSWLATLADRFPLGIVTGRPRADAEAFLERFGIRQFFTAVVTREDGPLKPSPAPVEAALAALGVRRAWMLGDTPDDVASARGAGVVPIGVVLGAATEDGATANPLAGALIRAGAARVISNPAEISQCLN